MKTMNMYKTNLMATMAGLIGMALLGAAPAAAEDTISLQEHVRLQMEQSQVNILAEQRLQLQQDVRWLDNPAVNVGPVEIIETASAGENHERQEDRPAIGMVRTQVSTAVAEDVMAKALRSPGLMGVYRYVALPALELAIEAVE